MRKTFSVWNPNDLFESLIEFLLFCKSLIHQAHCWRILEIYLWISHVLDEISVIETKPQVCELLHKIVFDGSRFELIESIILFMTLF